MAKRTKKVVAGVYSDPGVGKTDLVGSAQHLGKVKIIRPPQDHTDSILEWTDNLDERVIHNWDEMGEELDEYRAEGDKYFLYAIDSISILQDVLLDDVWDAAVRRNKNRADFWWDKQEYGINMGRLGNWMRHLVGANMSHVIWTAHAEFLTSPDRDKDGDPVEKLMPWVQGRQMPQKFCGYSNLVVWMAKTSKGNRVLKATSDEVHYAKDQYDAIPEKGVIIPRGQGMAKMMDLIYKARPAMKPDGGKSRRKRARRTTTRKGR